MHEQKRSYLCLNRWAVFFFCCRCLDVVLLSNAFIQRSSTFLEFSAFHARLNSWKQFTKFRPIYLNHKPFGTYWNSNKNLKDPIPCFRKIFVSLGIILVPFKRKTWKHIISGLIFYLINSIFLQLLRYHNNLLSNYTT